MRAIEIHIQYKGQRNATVFTKKTVGEAKALAYSLRNLPTFESFKAFEVVSTEIQLDLAN